MHLYIYALNSNKCIVRYTVITKIFLQLIQFILLVYCFTFFSLLMIIFFYEKRRYSFFDMIKIKNNSRKIKKLKILKLQIILFCLKLEKNRLMKFLL